MVKLKHLLDDLIWLFKERYRIRVACDRAVRLDDLHYVTSDFYQWIEQNADGKVLVTSAGSVYYPDMWVWFWVSCSRKSDLVKFLLVCSQ